MTITTAPQDKMIEHLSATAAETAKATGNGLTLRQESERLFIIDSTEDHETVPLFTVTRGQLFTAIEQWADETIKWFEDTFPHQHLDSAHAVHNQQWQHVTYDEDTARVVLEFAGEIAALPEDPFWGTVAQFLNTVRVATDAASVVATARTMFKDDQPANSRQAFFPGSGGNEQLSEALSDAGWTFTFIEGGYYYTATAPNGSALTYIEGDIELEPAENRPSTITLPVDRKLWQELGNFTHFREALAEADATGADTEPFSEAADDAANGIAAAVLNALGTD